MNTFAVAAVVQSAIFKSVHNQFAFEVLDYFIVRNTALLIVSLTLVWLWNIELFELPEEKSRLYWLKLMVFRSTVGQLGFLSFNISVMYAPVSLAFIIFNTNPFMISVLGLLLNGEPIHRYEIVGMLLSFIGLVVLSWSSLTSQDGQGSDFSEKLIGIIASFACAVFFSVSCVVNRKLKDVHFLVNSSLHSTVGITIAVALRLALLLTLGKPFKLFEYPFNVLLKAQMGGFCDSIAVMSVIIAFMSDASGFVSLFGYLEVVYAFFVDVIIFKIKFTLLQLLSAFFIVGVTITVAYIKLRRDN
jgi:drug/metabolite transporter (DMT)-like permease